MKSWLFTFPAKTSREFKSNWFFAVRQERSSLSSFLWNISQEGKFLEDVLKSTFKCLIFHQTLQDLLAENKLLQFSANVFFRL